ncbi:hypothetical protein C7G41_11400 [Bradyrhizobium sp. MOS002]|nr:hypothetical protein C7G41_11400 [Bradyrhizobium sp. MOS002]
MPPRDARDRDLARPRTGEIRLVCCNGGGVLPPPLAGEGWGEGYFRNREPPRGESPHPARCADLSRKRERCTEPGAA